MSIITSLKDRLSRKPSLDVQRSVIRALVTGKLHSLMEQEKLTKAQLAQKLGISKAAVSTLLGGDRNFTIDKLTEIAYQMNRTPRVDFVLLSDRQEPTIYAVASPEVLITTQGLSFGTSLAARMGNRQ